MRRRARYPDIKASGVYIMAMSYEFDCDVDSVAALLNDPQFLVDRCLELGELEAECEVADEGDTTVIHLTRKVERDLPAFLSKIFDPVQTLQMTEEWQSDGEGGWSGEFAIDIEGQPVSIAANFELYPTAAGSCYTIEHQVKARIPLIGGKVEKFVLRQTKDTCRAELDYLRDQLR